MDDTIFSKDQTEAVTELDEEALQEVQGASAASTIGSMVVNGGIGAGFGALTGKTKDQKIKQAAIFGGIGVVQGGLSEVQRVHNAQEIDRKIAEKLSHK